MPAILDGGEGNDVLEALVGADTLRGGNGSDTASYSFSAAGVTVDLKAGFTGDAAGGDVLQSIGNLTGSGFGDTLRGNNGANTLDGGGRDVLFGMGGADSFRFSTALGDGNVDRIGDFQADVDKILLDDAIFSELTGSAPWTPRR